MNSKRSTRIAALLTAAAATVGLVATSVAPAHASTYTGETLTVEVTPHDGRSTIGDNVSFYSLTDAENDRASAAATFAQVKAENTAKTVKVTKCKKKFKKKFGTKCITKTKKQQTAAGKAAIRAASKDMRTADKCYNYIANAWNDNRSANIGVDTSNCPWAGTYLAPFWSGDWAGYLKDFDSDIRDRYRMSEAERLNWAQFQNLNIPLSVPNSIGDVADNPADARILLERFYPQLSVKARNAVTNRTGTEFIQVRRSTHPEIFVLVHMGYLRGGTDIINRPYYTFVHAETERRASVYLDAFDLSEGRSLTEPLNLVWSTTPPTVDPNGYVCFMEPCDGPSQPVAQPDVFWGYEPGVTPGSMGARVHVIDSGAVLNYQSRNLR